MREVSVTDLLTKLHNQHNELGALWQAYRIFCEQDPKDDEFWKEVVRVFSRKGIVKSDFGSEMAQGFMYMLDKQFGGLRNEDN